MVRIEVVGAEGFEDIVLELRALAALQEIDLSPLAPEIEAIVRRARLRSASAGTDKDGRNLAPVTQETAERRGRDGKGQGPPLAPKPTNTSTVKGMTVDVKARGKGRLSIAVDWPKAPHVAVHAAGLKTRAGVVVRDIMGLDVVALAELEDLVADYVMGNASRLGPLGRARRAASGLLRRLFG